MHLPILLKYVFRIRVNCMRTCQPVPPLLHSRRSPNHFGMEFTSNNLHLHVSTAGDIIATLRFARFHAAPMHGLRPQTLLSALGPFAEQCSLFGPNGKMFGASFLGLSLNPEPSHSSVHQLSSTQPLARRFNASEGSPTDGERCRVVSSSISKV